MAYKRVCDICGKEINSTYFDPRRIEYKRRIFGTYKTVDICQECAEEMEKYIREKKRNDNSEYSQIHEEERRDADGCNGCKYEYVHPWVRPCLVCKRTVKDLYEIETNRKILNDIKSGKGLLPIKMEERE